MFDSIGAKSFENPTDILLFGLKGRYLWFCLEIVSYESTPTVINLLKIEFPQVSFVDYLPEIYRKNELNIDSVTIHPLNDQEYHTFVIDKVASWEIVPYIVGIIDEVSSNQWIRTLQKMALVNQMFDDIIDWKDDLHKHHWTHWTQHLASIYSVRDPSILIQTLKKDESFIQLIGDSLSRLLTTSTTICEDLETQGLYQLSDWWTRSKLTTINKINKKITSNK